MFDSYLNTPLHFDLLPSQLKVNNWTMYNNVKLSWVFVQYNFSVLVFIAK